ncbi:MAG: DUF424 family protein [archaeon]
MIFIKTHNSYRYVVAICDSELIGKIFEQGKFQLDVKENFFKGEEYSEDKAIKIIQNLSAEDATFNIIGENSIACAIKAGIISEQGIKKIQGIPFALVLL